MCLKVRLTQSWDESVCKWEIPFVKTKGFCLQSIYFFSRVTSVCNAIRAEQKNNASEPLEFQPPPQGRFGDPNLKLLLVSSHLWHVENDGMLLALLKGFMDLRSVMVIAFHIYTIRTDDAVSHFFSYPNSDGKNVLLRHAKARM